MSAPAALREATTYPAAELDRRFYAFALDRLLAWTLFAGAGYLAWRFFLDDGKTLAGVAVVVAAIVLVSLLFTVLLGVAGVSPGKALVGLRVVRFDDGRPIGFSKALVRTAVLGMFTLPTLGLGLATLAWTAVMDPGGRRRGGHDRISDSVVVDVRPAPVVEVDDQRPRAIVNLTAMRLMPSPTPAPGTPAVPPAPAAPPRTPSRASASTPPSPAPAPAAPASPVATPATPATPAAPATPPGPPTTPPPARPASPPAAAAAAPAARPAVAAAPVARATPAGTPPQRPADDALGGPTVRRPDPARAATSTRWRVTFDTGETFLVEGLALVGRRPEPRAGEPVKHLVPLRSSDMSLSKTHAQFQVVPDGALVVMDRGSTNGSVVVRQGVSKSLTAGRPSTLVDGDVVRFGDRTMTVAKETS